jgi:pimeloyl-ACP methyl ester carboxylesterase
MDVDDPPRVAACFHGFFRSGAAMWWIARALRAAGYREVIQPTFGYHLRGIEANAAVAADSLRALQHRHPSATIDLVTHSYGGVLARATWAEHALPPLRRAVMICPPNRGAQAASLVRNAVPVHRFGWDPLAQVLPGAPASWPLPPGEVGILTGGTGTSRGLNPLLGEDNDGTVRVDEARLDGARDFLVLPIQHSMMILSPVAITRVMAFLRDGAF